MADDLGINKQQLAAMQRNIDTLEQQNDVISNTAIRHAVSQRLVALRLLLRDGHLRNMGRPSKARLIRTGP